LKRFDAKYGLYEYEARNGYRYLAIGKLSKFKKTIETFNSEYDGINLLLKLAQEFRIDFRFCKYGTAAKGEFVVKPDLSNLPDIRDHNDQVECAIDSLVKSRPTFAIIDKGRSTDERSCVWIENGHFYGMGYFNADVKFTEPSEVRECLTPYKSNQYIIHLIYNYAEKHPSKIAFKTYLDQT
jgi:DNA polymerase-3 subunit epsilon